MLIDMTTPPKHPRLRQFVQNALLFAIVSFVCLLLLELAVRRMMPFFRPEGQIGFVRGTNGLGLGPANKTIRQATPKQDYDLNIHFNQYGFRDNRDVRTASEADWFAVGDSMTFGWGVEDNQRFSSVLEQKLAASGSAARVFNIAVPDNIIGYQRLVRYAEDCGGRVNHLIVGVCMENDLSDYTDGKSAWDLQPNPARRQTFGKEKIRGWLRRSALYNAISFGLQRSPPVRRFFEKIGLSRDVVQLSGKNEWNEAALRSSRDELVKLVRGRHALVLIIPARRLWQGDNIEVEQRVHDTFIGLLREANLQVVDLRPAQEKTGKPLSHYFTTDPHWNARGHALAAQELLTAVASEPQSERSSK